MIIYISDICAGLPTFENVIPPNWINKFSSTILVPFAWYFRNLWCTCELLGIPKITIYKICPVSLVPIYACSYLSLFLQHGSFTSVAQFFSTNFFTLLLSLFSTNQEISVFYYSC